jgi:RNA ligase (TIGR02306 family)
MTNWYPGLIRIEKYGAVPNTDSLDITQVYGENVIFKRGLFKEGDLAIYIPPETLLPSDPEHPLLKDNAYLKPGDVVRSVRLRGIFSKGFLVPATVLFSPEQLEKIEVGSSIPELLGVTKYEGPEDVNSGENENDRHFMPKYTDIESWPRYRHAGIIKPGDNVVLTLKIHGQTGRFIWKAKEGRLFVGSSRAIKASYVVDNEEKNSWWEVAKRLQIGEKLKSLSEKLGHDNTAIYGEVYGHVQKHYLYDCQNHNLFRIFNTFNTEKNRYNNWDETLQIAQFLNLPTVPELYRGPWSEELESLSDGPDPLNTAHEREGFVIKPLQEQQHYRLGRVIFKMVGETYSLGRGRKRSGDGKLGSFVK